ncbi:MAG: hypothetical protein ACLSH3_15810 [Alistipes finegoldii]
MVTLPQDVDEIRQLFQLIKTMLRSDKERYRHEIIRTLFTTAFYIITEINQREQPGEIKQAAVRCCSTSSCRFSSSTTNVSVM